MNFELNRVVCSPFAQKFYHCARKFTLILVSQNICETANHNCDTNAVCIPNQDLFTCQCNDNYNGDGFYCEYDECRSGSHNCDRKNGFCNNTDGSYTCDCSSGYEVDGYSCIDINECNDELKCPKDDFCINTTGSFYCLSRYTPSSYLCSPNLSNERFDFKFEMIETKWSTSFGNHQEFCGALRQQKVLLTTKNCCQITIDDQEKNVVNKNLQIGNKNSGKYSNC